MRGHAILAPLLLAGCGQNSVQPQANETNANGNASAATENLPSMEEEVENEANAVNASASGENAAGEASAGTGEPGSLPPANAALRFVGSWAKDRAACTTNPWRFTAKSLSVRDGPNCTFYKVDKAPGGYDIAAQCPGKEPIHTDLIKLRFAQSARAMLVESNAIKPMGLIYCGK
ncbi:MAG TPA: hypothetical protein VFK28_12130 [Sphingomicrobium sp.]|jgi:hypothetical protein|nr:hypothetical protein [Sphingomicrobium sp.]